MTHETEPAEATGTQPVIGGVTALLDAMGEGQDRREESRDRGADARRDARGGEAPASTAAMPEPTVAMPAPEPAAARDADVDSEDEAPAEPADGAKPLPFPVMHGRERGYRRDAVESFMAQARAAFERGDDALDARAVRQAGFPLVRGGYQIAAVDAALGRIEDAFAARERQAAIAAEGPEAWVERARAEAQVILERLTRPARRRFDRVGALSFGYAPKEVDAVADRISAFLQHGEPLTAEQVRSAAFRMTRGGYREEQVDAVLDAVVDVILAVR